MCVRTDVRLRLLRTHSGLPAFLTHASNTHLTTASSRLPPPIPPKQNKTTTGISKLAPGDEGGMEDFIKTAVPIGHLGDKRDIALTCVFLASPTAR